VSEHIHTQRLPVCLLHELFSKQSQSPPLYSLPGSEQWGTRPPSPPSGRHLSRPQPSIHPKHTHTLALFLLFLSDHKPLSPCECPIHQTLNISPRFKYTVIFQQSNISQVISNSSCFLMKQIIISRYDNDILTV